MMSSITTRGRVLLATVVTVLVLPILLWFNFGGDDGAKKSVQATPVASTSSTVTTLPPPVLYEVAADWQVRGHSRFSDSEMAKRSKNLTERLVIGSENVPEPLIRASAQRAEAATSTTRRTVTLAELGLFPVPTDPNYLTTTTQKPKPTLKPKTTLKSKTGLATTKTTAAR